MAEMCVNAVNSSILSILELTQPTATTITTNTTTQHPICHSTPLPDAEQVDHDAGERQLVALVARGMNLVEITLYPRHHHQWTCT